MLSASLNKTFPSFLPSFQSMEAVGVEELKMEKGPRISAEDLIELGELQGTALSRSPTKKKHNSKPMILVIDVRSQDEYPLGSRSHSLWE